MQRAFLFIALFGFAVFVSACGGGGGSSSLPASGGGVSKNTGATVRVLIPKSSGTSSSARKPAFIASNTATITIGIYTVNGATPSPLPTPLSIAVATSSDCTSGASGTTCTITVTVPVATAVVLQLSTYDASGNLLGQALIGPINTTLATIPTQSVSVGGVPATLTIAPSTLSATADGLTHQIPFTVTALDASGNTIIPPGAYPAPIALTITGDTNSALSLSATSIASPGPSGGASSITLSYDSTKPIITATITAAYGSVTASVSFTPIATAGGGGSVVAPAYTHYEYSTQTGGKNYGITVGPDGQTLWFVDQTNAQLGAVPNPSACNATSCSYSEGPVPWQSAAPTNLLAVTAASDGNLYATDVGNGISDYGNVFQLSCTPSPASCTGTDYPYYDIYDANTPNLTDVVAGPDGNLYISAASDCCDNSAIVWDPIVGCCNDSYAIEVAGEPSAINMMAFDQTGQTLWFTDAGNANVGFIAGLPCEVSCTAIEQPSDSSYSNNGPQGGAAHRPPPSGPATRVRTGGGPRPAFVPRRHRAMCCGTESSFTGPLEGIVAAPDGNIYVADASGSIDQISPSTWESCSGENCTYTAIGLPNASAQPQNLTIGRDGNVWFTDSSGYVGFVALNTCASGTCKAFEYSVGGSPWGITSGPDGNIWFTDSSTNKIGKVVL
ncbi:MAG TPA: hypothetical protein VMB20_04045 [Candidatus Acidoferrum sp.]|nr:hypothetical protein [Candidatus Acidoferrum sp.]